MDRARRHFNPNPPGGGEELGTGEAAVKMEEQASPSCSGACEAMDTFNLNNNNSEELDSQATAEARSRSGFSDVSVLRIPSSSSSTGRLKAGDTKQNDPMLCNFVTGRQSDLSLSERRTSSGKAHALTSPDFPSISGTPTSISQLLNLPTSAFSLDGLEFPSPLGSGVMSPLTSARLGRKRALSSISPLSTSSLDLNNLIRTSPTSLVNCIVTSRGSSAGSMGHLSPALFANPTLHQPPYSRPHVSLRNAAHPQLGTSSQAQTSAEDEMVAMTTNEAGSTFVKQEGNLSLSNSSSQGQSSIKQEGDTTGEETDLENGYRLSSQPLETLHEEEGSSDDEGMQTDPTDYSSAMTENESELEMKAGVKDGLKPRRIYYSYPSVEEPHNNHCRWLDCNKKCEGLDNLVQHVNNDHIYRDSRKDFVCYWSGCVREKRPFKAQYMLLVHMRRHTGEKPHKCTYEGCNKAYSRLENLKTHLRSHTGERPYMCKFEGCGKAFSNASDCAKHMNRTHSDEKPYACPNPGCTKRYTDPSSRRKHMKNCQANKRPRTDDRDAEDEESCAEMVSMKSASPRKSTKAKKSSDKKKPVASGSAAVQYPFKAVGDPGYLSGGSQGYMSSHTAGYNSSGYETDPYPGLKGEEELAHIFRQQRLSDPSDAGALTYPPVTSHIRANQIPPSQSPHHMVDPNGLASRQKGGGLVMPTGQPLVHPSHLQPHTPSHHHQVHNQGHFLHSQHNQFPPSFLASCQSNHSSLSGFQGLSPSSPSGALSQSQGSHHYLSQSSSTSPSSLTSPPDTLALNQRKFCNTASSGYSSARGYSTRTCKSPPSDDGSSLRSSNMTNSYSTFSSNSSRLSSPCSNSGRETLRPHNPSSPLPSHFMPQKLGNQPIAGGNFPLKHSLRMNISKLHADHTPAPYSTMRRSSEGSGCSWRSYSSQRTNSSQSSRYSSTGSELTDELLENLPTDSRRSSFTKQQPLPLPESMQPLGFVMEQGGMEFSQFSPQGGMSDGGEAPYMNERSPMQFSGPGYSQGLSPAHSQGLSPATHSLSPATQGLSPANQRQYHTLPLHHFESEVTRTEPIQRQQQLFGGDLSQAGGYAFNPEEQFNDFENRTNCTSPNMVIGNMATFENSLSEETHYLESLLNTQVK